MKTKVSVTDGKISMAFPASALELVYAKQAEVIAYFKATNNRIVKVVIDLEALKSNENWPGVGGPTCADWIFDEISERYSEIMVKRIEVLNFNGSASPL